MNSDQSELAIDEPTAPSLKKSGKNGRVCKWTLATNHLNLALLLAAGLIMPKSGFGKKYYQDTLDFKNGWILLFNGVPPKTAIDYSVEESKTLKACFIELSLKHMQGDVFAYKSGKWDKYNLDEDCAGIECILISTPLSLSCINYLVFSNKGDLQTFKESVQLVGNCPDSDFKITNRESAFKAKAKNPPWQPESFDEPDTDSPSMVLSDAIGGALANLNVIASNNEIAIQTLSRFSQEDLANKSEGEDPVALRFQEWCKFQGRLNQGNKREALFWGICSSLIENRDNSDFGTARDIVLDGLKSVAKKEGGKFQDKSEKVAADLVGLVQGLDVTVEQLLKNDDSPVTRALVLFFSNDNIHTVLESNRALLKEDEVALVAILLGLSTGWLQASTEMKTLANLNIPASSLMAKIVSGESPYPVGTLWQEKIEELPMSILGHMLSEPWSKKQKDTASKLCSLMDWSFVETRIKLAEGEYKLEVKRGSVEIVFQGGVKATTTEVDRYKVIDALRENAPLPTKIEEVIRKQLGA